MRRRKNWLVRAPGGHLESDDGAEVALCVGGIAARPSKESPWVIVGERSITQAMRRLDREYPMEAQNGAE